jgi:hypothetical protein
MTWWLWVIIGAIIYLIILLFIWALLKAAGDEDERRGYK